MVGIAARLPPDVPKHSEYHDTEKQEVQTCANGRDDNKGVLLGVKKKCF